MPGLPPASERPHSVRPHAPALTSASTAATHSVNLLVEQAQRAMHLPATPPPARTAPGPSRPPLPCPAGRPASHPPASAAIYSMDGDGPHRAPGRCVRPSMTVQLATGSGQTPARTTGKRGWRPGGGPSQIDTCCGQIQGRVILPIGIPCEVPSSQTCRSHHMTARDG